MTRAPTTAERAKALKTMFVIDQKQWVAIWSLLAPHDGLDEEACRVITHPLVSGVKA